MYPLKVLTHFAKNPIENPVLRGEPLMYPMKPYSGGYMFRKFEYLFLWVGVDDTESMRVCKLLKTLFIPHQYGTLPSVLRHPNALKLQTFLRDLQISLGFF